MTDQPGLPELVVQMRRDIAQAAVECDFDRLVTLALLGPDPFSDDVVGPGDPGAYWYEAEVQGRQPTRLLVCLLDVPYMVSTSQGDPTWYHWPKPSEVPWTEVPQASRDAIKDCLGEDRYRAATASGEYLGPQLVISRSGDWVLFSIGDEPTS